MDPDDPIQPTPAAADDWQVRIWKEFEERIPSTRIQNSKWYSVVEVAMRLDKRLSASNLFVSMPSLLHLILPGLMSLCIGCLFDYSSPILKHYC